MKKILLIVIMIFVVACTKQNVFTPSQNKEKIKQVDYFEFNFGSEDEGFYEYIIKEDQYYRLTISTSGNVKTHYAIDKYIKAKDVNELSKLVHDLSLIKWNNYNERGGNDAAGKSFNLRIAFRDNSYIGAKGFMKFPDDYEEKSQKIIKFLDNLSKKV